MGDLLDGWEAMSGMRMEGETDLVIASDVAVYVGEEKKPRLEGQTLTLTSQRMITGSGMQVELGDVAGAVEGKAGFLTSSPKIHFSVSRRKTAAGWKCPACEEDNVGGLVKCSLCGTMNPNRNRSGECGAVTSFRLSFRGSGYKQFLSTLQTALHHHRQHLAAQQQAKPTTLGVSGLMRQMEEVRVRQAEGQEEAFGDLEGLMRMAGEMAKVAEGIAAKLAITNETLEEGEEREFRGLVASLGLTTASLPQAKNRPDELSTQLASFTTRLFHLRSTPAATLADIYCLYNRARGTDLVSPADLARAASCLVDGPVRMRRMGSGLAVLYRADLDVVGAVSKIGGGATVGAVGRMVGVTGQLAGELLLDAELSGLLCRDQPPSSSTILYHPNLIL